MSDFRQAFTIISNPPQIMGLPVERHGIFPEHGANPVR